MMARARDEAREAAHRRFHPDRAACTRWARPPAPSRSSRNARRSWCASPRARASASSSSGHVTKDGAIAGPRVLEHLVDTVLYFESDASSRFRNVRATKNRFGSVGELAFFHMGESGPARGAQSVGDLPGAFGRRRRRAASWRSRATAAGRCWSSCRALVDRMRFGSPRRVAQGLDAQRVAMLLAVMNRHGGVSAAGARRVREPGRRARSHRDRLRSAGGAGAGVEPRRQADRAGAGRLRRNRPHRRAAPRGLWRRAAARGGQAGVHDGAHSRRTTRRARRSRACECANSRVSTRR